MSTQNIHSFARPPPQALGINVDKPKFPQYAVYTKRLESFEEWPVHIPVSKETLVEAGLVYTGVGDICRCYHCGGGLRNWEQGDNPMMEHAKWYPTCPHILLVKGRKYIDRVQHGQSVEENHNESNCSSECDLKLIETPAAMSCIQMGYQRHMVQKAVNAFTAKNRHCVFSGVDLCQILFDMEENPIQYNTNCITTHSTTTTSSNLQNLSSEDLELLQEENEKLKEEKLCKICIDKNADIIFLPCGHMICCPQCAPAMTKCPICRKTINGQIKAFFA